MNFREYSVVAACRCFGYDHFVALAKGFLVNFFFFLDRQEEHPKTHLGPSMMQAEC